MRADPWQATTEEHDCPACGLVYGSVSAAQACAADDAEADRQARRGR